MGTWEGLALGLNITSRDAPPAPPFLAGATGSAGLKLTSREAPPAPPVLEGGTSALLGSSDDDARTTKRIAGLAACLLVLKLALRACKVHAQGLC